MSHHEGFCQAEFDKAMIRARRLGVAERGPAPIDVEREYAAAAAAGPAADTDHTRWGANDESLSNDWAAYDAQEALDSIPTPPMEYPSFLAEGDTWRRTLLDLIRSCARGICSRICT